jgi:hypothetical protein
MLSHWQNSHASCCEVLSHEFVNPFKILHVQRLCMPQNTTYRYMAHYFMEHCSYDGMIHYPHHSINPLHIIQVPDLWSNIDHTMINYKPIYKQYPTCKRWCMSTITSSLNDFTHITRLKTLATSCAQMSPEFLLLSLNDFLHTSQAY